MTTSEGHRDELLRTFKNGPEDIDANRAGRLGPAQIRRMRRGAVNAVLIMVLAAAVLIAIILLLGATPIAPWRWGLIVVVAGAGIAVGVYQGCRLRSAVTAGVVECHSGPVRVAMRGRTGWWLTIGGHSYHLPVRFWHVGSGGEYRVYIAPAAELIVAMEPAA